MAGLMGAMSVLARFGGGGGRGGPLWMFPIMFVLGVIFVFAVIWVIFALVRYFYRSEIVPRKAAPETPLGIAQRRYASGELSGEEFEKIKQALLTS
jgi:uncharacterized membrane protein